CMCHVGDQSPDRCSDADWGRLVVDVEVSNRISRGSHGIGGERERACFRGPLTALRWPARGGYRQHGRDAFASGARGAWVRIPPPRPCGLVRPGGVLVAVAVGSSRRHYSASCVLARSCAPVDAPAMSSAVASAPATGGVSRTRTIACGATALTLSRIRSS